jgi:glycosyltransferase involved in cell wall biosynthesis
MNGELTARPERLRICYVVSSEMTVAAFLKGHIVLAEETYDVSVAVNTSDKECLRKLGLSATLLAVPIERKISLLKDIRALLVMYRHFRRQKFDLVHSVSPKAGLIGMLAAWLAGIPHRVHTFTGQVWVTKSGWRRSLLKLADWLIGTLTTSALVDSPSQRDFLVAEGVLPSGKSHVIGCGSICGVDAFRFCPNAEYRNAVRMSLNIPGSAILLLSLGRMNRDKGVVDLAVAFSKLAQRFPELYLLLVGPDEDGQVPAVMEVCGPVVDRVIHVGFTREPERFMAAADVFCLPSYREGFGMVIVEAAASGVPAVASRIYGLTDAVADGSTGLLHQPGNPEAIAAALERMILDPKERLRMGAEARARAQECFSDGESSRGLIAFYGTMLPKCP